AGEPGGIDDLAAERATGIAGGPVEVLDGQQDFDGGIGLGLAGFFPDDIDQFAGAAGDAAFPVQQPSLAGTETQVPPPLFGCTGRANGTFQLAGILDGVSADRLPGAWVVGRKHARSARSSRTRRHMWLRGLGHGSKTMGAPTGRQGTAAAI